MKEADVGFSHCLIEGSCLTFVFYFSLKKAKDSLDLFVVTLWQQPYCVTCFRKYIYEKNYVILTLQYSDWTQRSRAAPECQAQPSLLHF